MYNFYQHMNRESCRTDGGIFRSRPSRSLTESVGFQKNFTQQQYSDMKAFNNNKNSQMPSFYEISPKKFSDSMYPMKVATASPSQAELKERHLAVLQRPTRDIQQWKTSFKALSNLSFSDPSEEIEITACAAQKNQTPVIYRRMNPQQTSTSRASFHPSMQRFELGSVKNRKIIQKDQLQQAPSQKSLSFPSRKSFIRTIEPVAVTIASATTASVVRGISNFDEPSKRVNNQRVFTENEKQAMIQYLQDNKRLRPTSALHLMPKKYLGGRRDQPAALYIRGSSLKPSDFCSNDYLYNEGKVSTTTTSSTASLAMSDLSEREEKIKSSLPPKNPVHSNTVTQSKQQQQQKQQKSQLPPPPPPPPPIDHSEVTTIITSQSIYTPQVYRHKSFANSRPLSSLKVTLPPSDLHVDINLNTSLINYILQRPRSIIKGDKKTMNASSGFPADIFASHDKPSRPKSRVRFASLTNDSVPDNHKEESRISEQTTQYQSDEQVPLNRKASSETRAQ